MDLWMDGLVEGWISGRMKNYGMDRWKDVKIE